MRSMVKVYKALSDEWRLRVLNLLFERECCVCEVEQVLEVSQSKASRILSHLHEAGLLSFRKDGLWSLYSIDWDTLDPNVRSILEATGQVCHKNRQMAADRERLKTTVRSAACIGDDTSVSDTAAA